MTQSTRLYLLGKIEVHKSGEPVKISSSKAMGLLAYLATTNQAHSREHLMTLLWADSSSDAAAKNIRNTLWGIRKGFDEDIFVSRSDTLQLAPAVWSDVKAFEALCAGINESQGNTNEQQKRLLQLYSGQLMGTFSLPKEANFDIWLTMERERLEQTFLKAVNTLITAHRRDGSWDAVVNLCLQALYYDNFQEDVHAALMEAYARQGKRASALRQYETLVDALKETFDIEPQPEVQRLHQAIVDGKIRMAGAGNAIADDAARETDQLMRRSSTRITERAAALAKKIQSEWKTKRTPRAPYNNLDTPRLMDSARMVGRSEAYAALIHAYYHAEAGQSGGVIIQGERGMGKTRLLQQFERWLVSQTYVPMKALALQADEPLPYQLIRQALRPHTTSTLVDTLRIDDAWWLELSRLFPQLRTKPAGAKPSTNPLLLYEAIARLGMALADSNSNTVLVVMIDGLTYADGPSLDALQYLVRYWSENAVSFLLVGTAVPSAMEHSHDQTITATEWLLRVGRQLPLSHVNLAPLTAQDIEILLEPMVRATDIAISADDLKRFAQALHAITQGNPFYLMEYLQLLLDHNQLRWQLDDNGDWTIDMQAVSGEAELNATLAYLQQNIPPRIHEAIQMTLARMDVATMEFLSAAAVLDDNTYFEWIHNVANMSENDALRALDEVLQQDILREETAPGGRPRFMFTQAATRDILYSAMNNTRRTVFHRRAFTLLSEDIHMKTRAAIHAEQAGLFMESVLLCVESATYAVEMNNPDEAHRALNHIDSVIARYPDVEDALPDEIMRLLATLRSEL